MWKTTKQQIFKEIYANNFWGDPESLSGPGSSEHYTKNLRNQLQKIFSNLKIKSVLDAPCGDFNWMSLVVEKNPEIYFDALKE